MIGDLRILYIYHEGAFAPIGCITSNSLSESVETISTTTRENNGWETFKPMAQAYTISFDGVMISGVEAITHDDLTDMKRAGAPVRWKIESTDQGWVDSGEAIITSLSDASAAGELITFSAEMTGTGSINSGQGGGGATFDSDTITFDNINTTFDAY